MVAGDRGAVRPAVAFDPVGALWVLGRRAASERRLLATLLAATLVAVVASASETALLYRGGAGLDRVYYGTDTRATGLLVGASLAIGIALARAAGHHSPPARRHQARGVAALVALAMILVAMNHATGGSSGCSRWALSAWISRSRQSSRQWCWCPTRLSLASSPCPAARRRDHLLWPLPLALPVFSVARPELHWTERRSAAGRPFDGHACSGLGFFRRDRAAVRRRKVPPRILRLLVPAAVAGSVGALISAAAVGAEIQVPSLPRRRTEG